MKVLVFIGLLALAFAHPGTRSKVRSVKSQQTWDELLQTPFGQLYLSDTRVTKSASVSDLKIYFYTNKNKDNPIIVTDNDVSSIVNSEYFDSSARLISITHGWNNDYSSDVNTLLTDAILGSIDANILVSDWNSIAGKNYVTAEVAVVSIGEYLGDFINNIVSASGISTSQITLIGHSLGAHVAGSAGTTISGNVDLIIGLDPALPFITDSADERLDPTDADFVQIIHTCGGLLGYMKAIGTADYFPNGGTRSQPGCSLDLVGTCSHGRSYQFLADSIANTDQKYWAYVCADYDTYEAGSCTDKDTVSYMGTLNPDRSAAGSYYLSTNEEAPYAQDIDP